MSYSGHITGRRPAPRRPRVYRSAPLRKGGKVAKCSPVIDNDPDGRILLSNVGTDVESTKIEEKFGEFGKVYKVIVHCNKNQARIGTAEVWMNTSKDANKAKDKLNATDIFSDGLSQMNKNDLDLIFNSLIYQKVE